MDSAGPTRACLHCKRDFPCTRKDRIYCRPACRSAHGRAQKLKPLATPSAHDEVLRGTRARLAWLRQQRGLPPLDPSTRLDLEASLQAQRIAVQVSEVLLNQAPPSPRFVTSAFATDQIRPADLAAASEVGCGASWSADGRLFLVILLGSRSPSGGP